MHEDVDSQLSLPLVAIMWMAKLPTYSTEYLPPSAPFGLISLQAWIEVPACKGYAFQSFKPTEVMVLHL